MGVGGGVMLQRPALGAGGGGVVSTGLQAFFSVTPFAPQPGACFGTPSWPAITLPRSLVIILSLHSGRILMGARQKQALHYTKQEDKMEGEIEEGTEIRTGNG